MHVSKEVDSSQFHFKYMSVKKLTRVKFTRAMNLPQHPQKLSQQPTKYIVPLIVFLITKESYVTHGQLLAHF